MREAVDEVVPCVKQHDRHVFEGADSYHISVVHEYILFDSSVLIHCDIRALQIRRH